MGWKFFLMIIVKIMMIFRGSKSTSHLPSVEVENIESIMGTWFVAYYIAYPFQTHLDQLQYRLSLNGDHLSMIEKGKNKRKGKWKEKELSGAFRQHKKMAWFDITENHPYNKQLKFIYLNKDNNQAIVVGSAMNTIKIMYKNENFTKVQLDQLIAQAKLLGFKTKKLRRVDQTN